MPLTVWLPDDALSGEASPEILVLASIHGDEAETTIVLSEALRAIPRGGLKHAVILCASPDGIVRGTRGNAAGVDLNRNFPASNWSPEPVHHKTGRDEPRDIALSPGDEPASEPETRALLALLEELEPRAVVSLHSALACVDDPEFSELGKALADRSGLPLVENVGYATPGSFGSWAADQGLTIVTYELEAASPYDLKERHVPVFVELLTGRLSIGPL